MSPISTKISTTSFDQFNDFLGQIRRLIKLAADPRIKKIKENTFVFNNVSVDTVLSSIYL